MSINKNQMLSTKMSTKQSEWGTVKKWICGMVGWKKVITGRWELEEECCRSQSLVHRSNNNKNPTSRLLYKASGGVDIAYMYRENLPVQATWIPEPQIAIPAHWPFGHPLFGCCSLSSLPPLTWCCPSHKVNTRLPPSIQEEYPFPL